MWKFLVLAAFALAVLFPFHSARADNLIARGPDTTVILLTEPCAEEKILMLLKPEVREQYRAASVTYKGDILKACWKLFPEAEQILIVDETGDYGHISMRAFENSLGI